MTEKIVIWKKRNRGARPFLTADDEDLTTGRVMIRKDGGVTEKDIDSAAREVYAENLARAIRDHKRNVAAFERIKARVVEQVDEEDEDREIYGPSVDDVDAG